MNEMLGNQYFIARNFLAAQHYLEEALIKDPNNKFISRKLIICHAQTGRISESFKLFKNIIETDIEFIVNIDLLDEDCPCPEILKLIESQKELNESSVDYKLMLGIIWLFCDINNSKKYFDEAKKIVPNYPDLERVIFSIDKHIQSINSVFSD